MIKPRVSDRLLWGLEISSGGRAYPVSRLFFWMPVQYSRRKFRDLVRRLVRVGQLQQLVVGGRVQLRLAASGRQRLLKRFPVLARPGKAWDGFWRVLMFDIPEAKRKQRDSLRREINKHGFGRLQDSSYLTPYDWDQTFLDWLQNKGLIGSVLLLEAKQKHLGNPKNLAAKIWDLDRLGQNYQRLNERLTTRFGIKESKKRDEWLKRVHQEYLQLLLADPFFAPELLPEKWPGDQCRRYILQAGAVKE